MRVARLRLVLYHKVIVNLPGSSFFHFYLLETRHIQGENPGCHQRRKPRQRRRFRALRRIIIFWSTARRNQFYTGKRASLAAAEGPRRWRRCGTVSVRGWGRTPDPIPGTPPRGSYGRGAAANFVFLFRSTICTSVTRIDRYRL